MTLSLLYADDEIRYRRLLEMVFRDTEFNLLTAASGEELLELLGKHPDAALLILDVMMPGQSGIELCRGVRSFSSVPILLLTALGDESHEWEGLEAGADDYISKPFSNRILLSRVRALLRRSGAGPKEGYQDDLVSLDPAKESAAVEGKPVALTFREGELLKYLVERRDTVCPREKILDSVWGYYYDGGPRTLDTHIKSLRKKLGRAGERIVTHRQIGYRFVSGPTEPADLRVGAEGNRAPEDSP